MPGKIKKILSDDEKHKQAMESEEVGDTDETGEAPDPESDDTLENAHKVGLYEAADEEHPKEAGIAEEIEKDEKKRQKE